jgi:hypothetical protein
MSQIREGSNARHPDHGAVKVLVIHGDYAEVSTDNDHDGTHVVTVASLDLDPVDAAAQDGEN